MIALENHLPRLRVPWVPIGHWPTPLTALNTRRWETAGGGPPGSALGGTSGGQVWIKHEGDAHPAYGGNKVRTLEVWLGHARAIGARRIWAIGAYGSNHAVATVLHAPRAGLEGAAIVFPQPLSAWAVENCRALIASGCPLVRLRSVIGVPLAAWWIARRERDAIVMPPGGATTIGTFGALAAAFELADQIAAGLAPPPRRIVLAVGSTCTTAGLVAGLELARAIGLWRWPVPIVHGVRVTPWPVTSRLRTAELARRTLARVEQLGGPPVEIGLGELIGRLVIDGRELGPGYGRSTPQCAAAMRVIRGPGCPRLDAVYSGKAAAALLRLHRAGTGPLVFWASKSSATLARPADEALRNAPPAIARWLRRAAGTQAGARMQRLWSGSPARSAIDGIGEPAYTGRHGRPHRTVHAADPPDEAPLIPRREGEPPTAPTIDAPSWLRPGGRAPEEADAERVSATPPEVVPGAARPAPQAPGETFDASRDWAGETQLDTAGDAARRGPPGGPAADTARGAAGGAIAPGSRLRRIEQFVLLECIGAGGMGSVFAAFDDKLERKVAIKLVATRGGDERARQRLLREAQALARLSHPNVVTVYEAGTLPDGELFIAMELVKGQTLRAWQRQPGRSWRDIVAMYAEAGRGLAAAHHSGIVHRDFKPDNVLVGDDGRVRVADFGLAFAAQDTAAGAARPAPGPDAPGSPPPAQALTAAGRVAGTPGYMAPEQFAGAAVDTRADQFSFCAALHEALHGALPDATGAEPPAHGPRRRATEPVYPRWLRDVLQRGLARDPSERFATMDELLAELLLLRERTRRRILAAAVVAAGFIATAALSAALRSDDPPPCPLATAVLGGVWDAPVRARSEAALLGTGQPFASNMWASTRDALERYAQRWLRGQQAACEATYVRHVQSAELFDRRMECLAARRRSLAAAGEMLQRQPAEAVTHASELLTSLGDIEPCADAGALLAPAARVAESPASAAARPRVIAVRQQLASATALLAVDAVAAAEPIVTGAEQLARGIDDDALRAELLYARGRLDLAHGKIAESIAVLHQAVALAVSSHHDELPVDVWVTLAVDAGIREQRPDEIESWLSRGEAWLRRLGHPSDSRRILLERARGKLQYTRGNPRDAVTTLSHALDRAEALWGKDDPRLIPLLRDRAAAEARLRDARPAVADGERALALGLAAWGPSYPAIARSRLALGLLYLEQLGDVARSEHEIDLAIPQFRDQLGADSIEIANCEQVLSKAGLVRGDYAAALQHAERAEQILALRLGPKSPRRGEALNGVGVLRFMRKDYAGSLAAYETAYSILRAAYGTDYPTVAILLSNMGETLLALGRPDPARADFAQALEILRRKVGPDHADLALPLKGLGLASLGAGRFSDARAALEQALVLRTRSAAASAPQELAEIRWALARTLRALSREPARARELALAARDAYRGLGTDGDERVREIDRWLAAPGQPAP